MMADEAPESRRAQATADVRRVGCKRLLGQFRLVERINHEMIRLSGPDGRILPWVLITLRKQAICKVCWQEIPAAHRAYKPITHGGLRSFRIHKGCIDA